MIAWRLTSSRNLLAIRGMGMRSDPRSIPAPSAHENRHGIWLIPGIAPLLHEAARIRGDGDKTALLAVDLTGLVVHSHDCYPGTVADSELLCKDPVTPERITVLHREVETLTPGVMARICGEFERAEVMPKDQATLRWLRDNPRTFAGDQFPLLSLWRLSRAGMVCSLSSPLTRPANAVWGLTPRGARAAALLPESEVPDADLVTDDPAIIRA